MFFLLISSGVWKSAFGGYDSSGVIMHRTTRSRNVDRVEAERERERTEEEPIH